MRKIRKLVIIGAHEYQRKLISKAKEMNYETHVFAWEKGAAAKDLSDYFYPISITEKEKILEQVQLIKPDGICSIAADITMPTVNFIAEKIGLVGNSMECTLYTTNKFEMRNVLHAHKLPCPHYQLVKSASDLKKEEFKLPIIVKPIDRSGSRGVYEVKSFAELEWAIQNAQSQSFADEVLVEEYIDGKEFSVEFITQNGIHEFLQITEKFTTGTPSYIEKGHLSPARLVPNHAEEIIHIVKKALSALKVSNGASHSEIKITTKGEIKIIEIAARMGGGFIGSDMVYLSTGYDFLKNVIRVAVGEKIDMSKKTLEQKFSLVGFVFDDEDKKSFKSLIKRNKEIVKEYVLNQEMQAVRNSSDRNGYYIMQIARKEELSTVLRHMNLKLN